MSIEDIFAALLVAHPSDYPAIRKYIAWVEFRRVMHNTFYQPVHWAQSEKRYHWVGA